VKNLLLITLFLPAATAVLAGLGGIKARCCALAGSLATLICAVVLAAKFHAGDHEVEMTLTQCHWFAALGTSLDIQFSVALDGLGLWLFVLTALLLVVAVLVSWEAIQDQKRLYYRLLLLLGTGMLGVFVARDIILFYLFFEFTLIPLFFLIGIWGSDQRRYAAIKFFLFTLAGSVLTLLGLLAIVLWDYWQVGHGSRMTFSIPELTKHLQDATDQGSGMGLSLQLWLFLALFAGFAIKVPLFPLHTWLPLAHTEAPAAGSILLAGVLLKIGTYGFLRFSMPMLPAATAVCMPYLLWLAVAGIVYGALVALAQSDMKKLIAYSSVSHLGFCMLGLFALNRVAVQGGALQMINHGLSTGGLFALVGMLYERYHTRQIADFGGIARETPILAFFMVFMTLASIGLPGLNGFAGEFLLLLGMFQRAWGPAGGEWAAHYRVISVLAVSGVVLGAWYMLSLIMRVFFGPLREHRHAGPIPDMKLREVAALVPVCVVIVWIGVQPRFFLDRMAPSIDRLTEKAMSAVASQAVDRIPEGSREDLTQRRKGAKGEESLKTGVGTNVNRLLLEHPSSQSLMPCASESCPPPLCAFAPLRENSPGPLSPDRFPLETARVP